MIAQEPPPNIHAEKLSAMLALLFDATDEQGLAIAKQQAARIAAMSDEEAAALLHPEQAAPPDEPQQHAREGDPRRLWVYECPYCGGDAYTGIPGQGVQFRGSAQCSRCGKGFAAFRRTPISKEGPFLYPQEEPLQHARGNFLDALRYEAPRVPEGAKISGQSGGSWIEAHTLARFYANLYNALSDAGKPPAPSEVDEANDELEPHGWAVEKQDGRWMAVDLADGEETPSVGGSGDPSGSPDPDEPLQHRRVKKGTPGAIERTFKSGKLAGKHYYVDKITPPRGSTSAAAREERAKRGTPDKDKLRKKIKGALTERSEWFHDEDTAPGLSAKGKAKARASLGGIRRAHGEQTLHRLEEIADYLHEALDATPKDSPHRIGLLENLSRLDHMIEVEGGGEEKEKDKGEAKSPDAVSYPKDWSVFVSKSATTELRARVVADLEKAQNWPDAKVAARIAELEAQGKKPSPPPGRWDELQGLYTIQDRREKAGVKVGEEEKNGDAPTETPRPEPDKGDGKESPDPQWVRAETMARQLWDASKDGDGRIKVRTPEGKEFEIEAKNWKGSGARGYAVIEDDKQKGPHRLLEPDELKNWLANLEPVEAASAPAAPPTDAHKALVSQGFSPTDAATLQAIGSERGLDPAHVGRLARAMTSDEMRGSPGASEFQRAAAWLKGNVGELDRAQVERVFKRAGLEMPGKVIPTPHVAALESHASSAAASGDEASARIFREAARGRQQEGGSASTAANKPRAFRGSRDASDELQAIRNDLASGTADPQALKDRVDAVGRWAATQKNAASINKVLAEANSIADRLAGGSGKGGVQIRVTEPPAVSASFKVGQELTYTGRAGSMPAEFRGFHNDPTTGEKVARVIVRPESGPPFETSVKVSELSTPSHYARTGMALRYRRAAESAMAEGDEASAEIFVRAAREG